MGLDAEFNTITFNGLSFVFLFCETRSRYFLTHCAITLRLMISVFLSPSCSSVLEEVVLYRGVGKRGKGMMEAIQHVFQFHYTRTNKNRMASDIERDKFFSTLYHSVSKLLKR